MKKVKNIFFALFLFIIMFNVSLVHAKEVTIDEVVTYMSENSIFSDRDYFKLFGIMFNDEMYDISSLSYTVTKEESNINIHVKLENNKEPDAHITEQEGAEADGDAAADAVKTIEKDFVLTVTEDNKISYTNNAAVDSLESKLVTFIFNQVIYSVGGARGYDKEYLVEWMNQIDLNSVSIEEGINATFERKFYTVEKEGTAYEYEFYIPKNFLIDANALTDSIPQIIKADIHDVKQGYTDISMQVHVENHENEVCYVYRRESSEEEYKKIGQVLCNNEQFVDTNVEVGKNYYYQAALEGVIMCSNEVEAHLEELPLTGAFISIGSVVLLIVIELVIFRSYKNYKKIAKI